MELTARKRELLRRVVEEYVSTGQPVGSKALVERPGLAVSSSTVRSELAELEALGLLTHPHTSAGRVPTERGYRVYAEELARRDRAAPGAVPARPEDDAQTSSRRRCRRRPRRSRRRRTCWRSCPRRRSRRHGPPRGGAPLQPRVVMVVVITASGGVTKRVFELRRSRSTRGSSSGPASTSTRRSRASARAPTSLRRALRGPGAAARERLFLDRPAGVRRARRARSSGLYVGGAAGLLGDVRARELEAYQRLLEVLERRAAVLALLQDALDPKRPVIRVGPELEGAELHERRARRRHLRPCEPVARRGRPARPAADGLRDGDPLRAGGRVRAVALRRGGLRAASDPAGRYPEPWRRRNGLLRAARRLARREPCGDQEAFRAPRARAPSRREDARTRGRASARSPRPTRCSPNPSGAALRPLRARGRAGRRLRADDRLRHPVGRLRGVLRRRPLRHRGPRPRAGARAGSRRQVEIDARRRRQRDDARRSRSIPPRPASPAAAPAPSPEPPRSRARPAPAPAGCSRSRGAILGQFVRSQTCPRCDGTGTIVERPASAAAATGARSRTCRSSVDIPAGIHDGQRIRVRGEGHAGLLGGPTG